MFSTKNQTHQEVPDFISSYLPYGFNKASIKNFTIRTAQSGKIQVYLHLEGDKVTVPGFTGAKYRFLDPEVIAQGPYACASITIYFSEEDEVQRDRLMNKLAIIADVTGKRKEIDAISAITLEEYLTKFVAVVKDIPAYYKFKAKEWEENKYELIFSEYRADNNWYLFAKAVKDVVSVEVEGPIQKLFYLKGEEKKSYKFDKGSKYDYEKYVKPDDTKKVAAQVAEDDTY